jgi:tetratricopeptide (TPR) repeat protein
LYEEFLDSKHAHDTELLHGLKTVGDILVKIEMLSEAELILHRLLSFYKDSALGSSQAAILIVLSLSKCHYKQHDDTKEEQTLRDIFDVLITQSLIESTTVTICIELASFYNRTSRWSEAVDVTSRLLVRLWDAILLVQRPDPKLPSSTADDAIRLATNLASYYMKMSRAAEAENIYLYIFLSCRKDLTLDDRSLLDAAEHLVEFYEATRVVDKAISVLLRLKEDMRTVLGTSNKVYIEISYRLAHLYESNHRPQAGSAYRDIFKDCGGHKHGHGHDYDGSDHGPAISMEAILALIRLCEKQRQVSELLIWYETLWVSFHDHGEDTGLDMKTDFDIFVRYITTVEQTKGLVEAIALAEELRSIFVVRYGAHHIYTIQAILELAQMLEKDEAHHEHATRLYEEITRLHLEDYGDRAVIDGLIIIARERLAHLFSCHDHTVASAEAIWVDIWEDSKRRYGCTHRKTLDYLSKMMIFFAKRGTVESTELGLRTLRAAIIEILEQERDSRRLFNAAEAVFSMYAALRSKEVASKFLLEIRREFSKGSASRGRQGSSTRLSSLDRRSFIFVLTLEQLLRGNKSVDLFTDVSRDLMTETTLYESWMRALQYGGSLETRLSIGARLFSFLDSEGCIEERDNVEEELWTIFYKDLKAEPARAGILWDLFQICLKEVKKDGPAIPLFDAATDAVLSYYQKGNFRQSCDLATWLVRFVEQQGGWNTKELVQLGLKLALYLAGRHSTLNILDRELETKMRSLSVNILIKVFSFDMLEDMDFGTMELDDINVFMRILPTGSNFQHLEVSNLYNNRRNKYLSNISRASWPNSGLSGHKHGGKGPPSSH